MRFCAFSMQIDNYRVYARIKRMNLARMTRSDNCLVRVLPGFYRFMVSILSIWEFEVPFSLKFLCFDYWFVRFWKFFVTSWIAISFERNLQLFPVELAIYFALLSGSFVFFFSVNRLSENCIAAIRRFFASIYRCTNFSGFDLIGNEPSHAWVILEI